MKFTNRHALFRWGISVGFLLASALITFALMFNDTIANSEQSSLTGVVIAIWIASLGFSAYSMRSPLITLTIVNGNRIVIDRRYPFSRTLKEARIADVTPAVLIESWSGDGDPYFFARVTLRDGMSVDIAEGIKRDHCTASCAQFNQSIQPYLN